MPPSSEPFKLQVLQALLAQLQAIAEGSTYFNTFVDSYVSFTNLAPPSASGYPAIFLAPMRTGYDNSRGRVVRTEEGEMRVQVTALDRTASDVVETIERLIYDVKTAIHADPTLGGLVIHTKIISDESLYPTVSDNPICGADLVLQISYRASRADLTSIAT